MRPAPASPPDPDEPHRSRLRRMGADLTRREWGRLAVMLLIIVAVNLAGWGIYVFRVMPHHFDYKGEGGAEGSASGSASRSRRGSSGSGTPSTPITSPASTTPPAS